MPSVSVVPVAMFRYGNRTPEGDSIDSRIASTRLVSVTTAVFLSSVPVDARRMSPQNGESLSWLSMSTRAEGSCLVAIRAEGTRVISGSNSVTSPVGNGCTVLTRRNCSRWSSSVGATNPATGTGSRRFFVRAKARLRCCPSTIHAGRGPSPSGAIGISSVPAMARPSVVVGPRLDLNLTSGGRARINPFGNRGSRNPGSPGSA